MPQSQHPSRPQLRQAQGGRWFTRWGHIGLAYSYGYDIGRNHADLYFMQPVIRQLSELALGPQSKPDFDIATERREGWGYQE